jgi:AraC-like DNA-binding protein
LLIENTGAVRVVGLWDEVALPELPAGTRIRGVRLRPEAVAAAFGVDAWELRNQTLDLADVVGTRRSRALVDERTLDAWVRGVEPDRRAAAAVRLLEHDSVDATADALGLSARQLRRLFDAHVGVGPKTFQRVLRFQRFVQQADHGVPLALAAADAGYSDQAHMSREVQRMSGVTPLDLVTERRAS